MFSLTVREQILVAAVLFAMVGGTAIRHWRVRSPATVARVALGAEKKTPAAEDLSTP